MKGGSRLRLLLVVRRILKRQFVVKLVHAGMQLRGFVFDVVFELFTDGHDRSANSALGGIGVSTGVFHRMLHVPK